MVALWQAGDIVASFRASVSPPAPQDSGLGVWSSDGSVFRGYLHLSPPISQDEEGLQNLTYYNGYIYGRGQALSGADHKIYRANGEQGGAEIFYELGSLGEIPGFPGGGGIDIDDNGRIYIADFSAVAAGGGLNHITILNESGQIEDIIYYDSDDPNIDTHGIAATCVRVTRDGSTIYFDGSMSNYGTPVNDVTINRIDVASRALLPHLNFTYPILNATDHTHFNVDRQGRIWILYEDFERFEFWIAICSPDGAVLDTFPTNPDSGFNEAIALNSDDSVILTHVNLSGPGFGPLEGFSTASPYPSLFQFGMQPVEQFVPSHQEEGFCFISSTPTPAGGVIVEVMLVG